MQQTPEIPQVNPEDLKILNVMNPRQADTVEYRRHVTAMEESDVLPIQNGAPSIAHKHERPSHRLMCLDALAGATNVEIAAHFQVDPVTVSNVLRQPWAKKFMAEEANRIAKASGIQDFIAAEAINSVRTLIEIRDDATAPKATRASVSIDLLDRHMGKSIQRVVTEQTITQRDASEEVSKIDAELAALREQVNGRNTGTN